MNKMPLELGVWRIDKQLTRIQVSSLDQEQRLFDYDGHQTTE
jgi:hypothetical protein